MLLMTAKASATVVDGNSTGQVYYGRFCYYRPAFVRAAPCIRFVIKSIFGAPGLSGFITVEPTP